jgi:tRNA dimethylallyltransferase
MLAIVGPTASGKSALALKLAQKYNGEIICVDSRTICKGMDIGTAKPSGDDRQLVAHHCLDIINPDQIFSVADFKAVAINATEEIKQQGRLPILVGGSGLYMDSILYDFTFPEASQNDIRDLSLKDLQELALSKGLKPSDQTLLNKRHLSSYISRGGELGGRREETDVTILGLLIEKEELHKRIEHRVEDMFASGLVQETQDLLEKWGENAPGLGACGYGSVVGYIKGDITLNEAKDVFTRSHKQLAKKQMTWFKRNKDIHWVGGLEEAEQVIALKLS